MAAPGPARGAAPEAVSPGSATRFSTIESGCPTFSWGRVEGASAYELVAYETPQSAPLPGGEEGEPALRVALPGTASSWTPPLERCLAPGRRYAWAVRAPAGDGGQGGWSAPKLFEVAPAPSAQEVARALAIVGGGWRRSDPTEDRATIVPASPEDSARAETGTAPNPRAEPSAPASGAPLPLALAPADAVGLYAEPGETTGVVFGLHGVSNSSGAGSVGVVGQSTAGAGATAGILGQVASPGGTAGVFDNTAGGPVLRGLSGGVEVFSVAGTGDVSAVGFTGDGSGLTGVDADTLGGNDSAAFAAAAHVHDDRYFTETEMTTGGSGAGVHWDNLTGVPAGFADGVDADTTYRAAAGLELTGTRFGLPSRRVLKPGDNTGTTIGAATAPLATIGIEGLGVVGYLHLTAGSTLAFCDDADCSSLSSSALVGGHGYMTLGADGRLLIITAGPTVTHCDDATCSSGTSTPIEASATAGPVVIGADGLALIAYRDGTNLKVAHCSDPACTSATITVLDTMWEFDVPSIAVGSDGLGLIAYKYDGVGRGLEVAHCDNAACSSATLTTLDASPSNTGFYPSVAIGADGLGLISYFNLSNAMLKVAHCADTVCSSATTAVVDAPCVDVKSSTAIGGDGLGLIAYVCVPPGPTNKDLKVAHCANMPCSASTAVTLASGDIASVPHLAIGADGLGLLTYQDVVAGPGWNPFVRVIHCGNPFCLPYFRRR